MVGDSGYIRGSLFEEAYLLRTLGNPGTQSEVGLTELVVNTGKACATIQ